ncbi:MAG: sulfatase-like hydrolase/transferase [Alphaproteobacteria bacterium]|nr:sulfatase-like hydrolase/transferase [Alphaproteobacteria bacterium]
MRRHLAALLLASALVPAPALALKPPPPNIVLIIADDWGFSDPGSYGSEMATPTIDALARRGTRFANFHVAASCSPTRAMLLTGVNAHRAGLGNMPETIPPDHAGKPGYNAVLAPGVRTLAQRLHRSGYATLYAGKWHLGHDAADLPTARGWDHALALSQSGADNWENKPNRLLYERADWTRDGKTARLPRRFYSSTLIVDEAIAQVGAVKDRPFFLTLGFLANHIPVQASDADIARYRGRYDAGWTALRSDRAAGVARAGLLPAITPAAMDTTRSWPARDAAQRARWARAMEAYGGMATAMDRELGRLIAHLKASGQYDNTVFVFTSDNGAEATNPEANRFTTVNAHLQYDMAAEHQGQPGSFTYIGASWASAAVSPLRGYKFSAWEGGVRVPFIVTLPPAMRAARGAVASAPAHAVDLAPTLLDLAGVAARDGLEGRSLLPALDDPAAVIHPENEAIGYELSGNAVLYQGRFKLVRNLPPYGDGAWHLHDIMADPGEQRDLAGSDPARLAAMQAGWAAWARANQVLPMPAGYSAPQQIQDNATRNLLPGRVAPLLASLWLLAVGLWVGRRWRRAQAGSNG